jgi:hypothetical protein
VTSKASAAERASSGRVGVGSDLTQEERAIARVACCLNLQVKLPSVGEIIVEAAPAP